MKFAQNLPRNQVPEWASSYIGYKSLKKLIKAAVQAIQHGAEADLAEFFFTLDRNLEDVDDFYNKKYAESNRRLRLLHDRYDSTAQALEAMDRDELEDLMGALLELRAQLRKLQWYGEVNRRGFVKITKKLDKKVPGVAAQQSYLISKVDPKAFASNSQLSVDMKEVNDWLSRLGEIHISDDASSVKSSGSTRIVSSRAILSLPPGLLDTVDQAIRSDDSSVLEELLMEANTGNEQTSSGPAYQKLLVNLLQRSISCRSRRCIEKILSQITSLDEDDDIDHRNCIHRLVISIGRSKATERKSSELLSVPATRTDARQFILPAEMPLRIPLNRAKTDSELFLRFGHTDQSVQLLSYLLEKLSTAQRSALLARDTYGRLPLHYAAEYGACAVCEILIKYMRDWNQFDVANGIDAPEWQDKEGLSPLHLSVINEHILTTKALLQSDINEADLDGHVQLRGRSSKSGSVLTLAAKSNAVAILKLLVLAGFDVNHQDSDGETALHVAARYGHEDCAKILLDKSHGQHPAVDIPENTFAWTPLFIACVDGHLSIAKLVLEAGADVERLDTSGWTAKEHAALRGHLDIAECIYRETPSTLSSESDQTSTTSSSPPTAHSLDDRKSNGITDSGSMRAVKPVKTFGHRYLVNETMVLVSLGSMDARKNVEPVKLDAIPLENVHSTQLDTALSIVVSAKGATGEPMVIDLPTQENLSTDPVTFITSDPTNVKLLFDIVPTYAGSKDKIVGRGVAMLSTIRPNIGSKRMNLQGDMSVPIISANTLEVIGCVNFNFLVITPFSHPSMSISKDQTYWKSMASTMVIGHRGLGKNSASRRSLQLGENTIQSFIAAANLGASYVEFDVQLTKDHVPVIYHDFLVSETGIDAPVHTLTLEQFLHVSESQTPRPSRPNSPRDRLIGTSGNAEDAQHLTPRRPRAYSAGSFKGDRNSADIQDRMKDRMKHTRDFKTKGYKANTYGNFIQAPFTTLEEMFHKLPESIGFNIEMKYPMLFESEAHEMDTYAVELNSFVDTVLTKVYDLGKSRNIIFSSFNPDICLLLSFKQPSIPVLFLTDAGTEPVGDIRASSLQEAIRFASRWNLLGVVTAAWPLVMCPRLVKVVKESGLVCVSYGVLNNDPSKVKLQVNEGIDAVIVDSVLAIRKGLTGPDAKIASATNAAEAVMQTAVM